MSEKLISRHLSSGHGRHLYCIFCCKHVAVPRQRVHVHDCQLGVASRWLETCVSLDGKLHDLPEVAVSLPRF